VRSYIKASYIRILLKPYRYKSSKQFEKELVLKFVYSVIIALVLFGKSIKPEYFCKVLSDPLKC